MSKSRSGWLDAAAGSSEAQRRIFVVLAIFTALAVGLWKLLEAIDDLTMGIEEEHS